MEELFIPYIESIQLKELGFDEPCFAYYENQDQNLVICYNNTPLTEEQMKRPEMYSVDNRNSSIPQWATSAPTFDQLFKWFRKKHGIHTFLDYTYYDIVHYWFKWFKNNGNYGEVCENSNGDNIESYEEMDLERIRKSIELLKNI